MKDLTLRFHSIEHRRDEPAASAARLVRAPTARLEQSYQQLCALRPHFWRLPRQALRWHFQFREVRPAVPGNRNTHEIELDDLKSVSFRLDADGRPGPGVASRPCRLGRMS